MLPPPSPSKSSKSKGKSKQVEVLDLSELAGLGTSTRNSRANLA